MKLDTLEDLTEMERVMIVRKRFNLSQFQFAEEIGISASYYSQLERGKCELTKTIKKRVQRFVKDEILHGRTIDFDFESDSPLSETEKIYVLRKRFNLTQSQFAKKLGFSTSYIEQIERGKLPLSNQLRKAINEFIYKE